MAKIAIIDLDGVVCNNEARMEHAKRAKEAYRQRLEALFADELNNNVNAVYVKQGITALLENLYWQVAFTPELVTLDTLIEGVPRAIEQIELAGYNVFFLTSRPESMRQATTDWIGSLTPETVLLSGEWSDQLIMKPAAFQFVKTTTWKAGTIQTLAQHYHADTVLAVDDDQANIDELNKHVSTFGTLYTAKSLEEAVKIIYA